MHLLVTKTELGERQASCLWLLQEGKDRRRVALVQELLRVGRLGLNQRAEYTLLLPVLPEFIPCGSQKRTKKAPRIEFKLI